MTTQTAVLAAPTGLTLTAKLFTLAAPDTTAFTADSVTERTNAKGQYVASFGEASAISGDHTLILFSGTRPVAIGYRTFSGTDAEVATETPPTVELDSVITNQLNDIEADSAAAVGYLTTLVGRITSGVSQMFQDLIAMITGSGTPAAKFDADALSLAPSSSGGLTSDQNTALLGIAAAVSGGSKVEATGRVAAGGKVTAYVGDDFRVRSGTALTIPVSDPAGTLYTKLTTITVANLRFAVSAPGKSGSQITGTISGITTSGSGADRLCLIAVEITNCGASLPPGDQYFYQVDQIQNTSDDFVEVEGKFWLKQRARAV